MDETISQTWWVFALRGVVAILFGILAFARPGISLAALVAVFGAYAFVDGVVYCCAAPSARRGSGFWWLLLDGLLGIAAGVITFIFPGAAAAALLFLLGCWLVFSGVMRIGLGVELRKVVDNAWLLVLGGFVSVAAGVLVFYMPGPSLLAWIWVIGIYAVFYGCVMLAAGFGLKSWASHHSTATI